MMPHKAKAWIEGLQTLCRIPPLPVSLLAALAIVAGVSAEEPSWKTGGRFRAALKEPLTASWRNIELRSVLEQISRDREIAILLDRRINPNQVVPVEFVHQPLLDGLLALAEQLDGGCSAPDNVIYLGPREAARRLRTLLALRTQELASDELRIPEDRRQIWLKRRTVRWDDLDAPREILDRLQSDVGFDISNPQAVEHDLWAEAVLPQVDGIEALSLILVQFDLTFRWRNAGQSVELVPIPDRVHLERSHKPRGKPPEKALADWQASWPAVDFRLVGREIVARATLEEHEEIASGKPSRQESAPPLPLSRRRFTLKIKDVSARDLMAELEKSGVVFEVDPQALKDAGVDLDRFVELNVRNLDAEEFFRHVFDPLGVRCSIDGRTVKLMPK
jgi:hypothetical protein